MAFDETCYHRDFVAVKCDPETELVHRVDGWEGAAIAYKAQDERLLALQKKREKIDQNMAERYKNALKGAHMDTVRISLRYLLLHTNALLCELQQKDILDRELEQILIEDRRRRQLNAGQHAAFFRNLYMEVGEKDLEQRFNTQFRTEGILVLNLIGLLLTLLHHSEEHIEATTERAPPSSRAKPQSGFPRRPPKPMSPNLSIEFVPANLALQKKSWFK